MFLSTVNHRVFLWINASATPAPFLLKVAIFISHDLIGIYLLLCTVLLIKGNSNYKKPYLHSLLLVLIGVCIDVVLGF